MTDFELKSINFQPVGGKRVGPYLKQFIQKLRDRKNKIMSFSTSTTEMPIVSHQIMPLNGGAPAPVSESSELLIDKIINEVSIGQLPLEEEILITTAEYPTTMDSEFELETKSVSSTPGASSFLHIDVPAETNDLDTPENTHSSCCCVNVNRCDNSSNDNIDRISLITESIQNMIMKECGQTEENFDILFNEIKSNQQKLDDTDLKIQSVNDQLANIYEVMRVYILPPSSIEYLDKLLVHRKLRVSGK